MMNWLFTMSEAAAGLAEADALTAATANNSALVELPLISKGLLATGLGLLGVFLVLGLFFGTIKLMQRIKVKEGDE